MGMGEAVTNRGARDAALPAFEHYYLRDDAIAVLGVSLTEFYALIKSGQLPRRGSNLRGGRYARSEVLSLRKAREIASAHPPSPTPVADALKAPPVHVQKREAPAPARPSPESRMMLPVHLYLVEFVGRCVKVGISTNPTKRLASHAADGRKFGHEIGRVWISYPHKEAVMNEKLLKIGSRSRTEYLERRFERLVARAHKLTMTRVEVGRGE